MEQDERTKKLLAGKEKLAAFQRKRAKRKKKKETDDGASDYTWSESSSVADLSDVASTGDFSDTGSLVDENERTMLAGECSDEDNSGSRRRGVSSEVALVRAENKLDKATDRIMALEESLHGKEEAMTRLLEENDQLRSDLATKGTMENAGELNTSGALEDRGSTPDKERDDSLGEDSYQHKLEEFEAALKQRDDVIAHLTENLRATTASRDTLQQEYTAQAAELARQVQTLQLQLQQAGEWLKNRMGEHGISAQALLEAKNELLALQQVNSHKEQEIAAMRSAVLERDQALHKVVEQYKTAAEQANYFHQENARIQEQNENFNLTINELQSEIEQLRKQNGTLSQENITLVQTAPQQSLAAEKVGELSSLHKALDENMAKIKSLEKELLERDSDVLKLKETITQKDQSLQQMALALSSLGTNETTETEDGAENPQLTIAEQKEEILSLQERIRQKDNSLQQLTEKFNKTSEQLNMLYVEVSALKEKEHDVLLLRETIREKEETLITLKETVKVREEKLLILQQSMSENEESLASFRESENTSSSEGEEIKLLQDSVTKLKDEITQKELSLGQISESCRALGEENARLKAIEQESYELVGKLNQASHDLAILTEENKQMKQAENEIASLAQQIPLLSKEMQTLKKDNKELKEKEALMYEIVEQMKEREALVEKLGEENARLKIAVDESKQKIEENRFLSQQVKELENQLNSAEQKSQELQKNNSQINDEFIETQQEEIHKYQAEISELKKLLQEKETLFVEQTEYIHTLTNEIEVLKQANESLNDKLLAEKADMESNVKSLAETQNVLEDKEVMLQEALKLKTTLEEQILEVTEENKLLKEKQNEFVMVQDSIDLKEKEIEKLEDVITSKETYITELTHNINELTINIRSLNEQILLKTTEIEQMKLELEQSNLSLVELNVKIQTLSESHAELEMENRNLKKQASDYEQLKKTAGRLEEKDNMILDIQEKLRNKEIEFESLQKEHSENICTVQSMEGNLISLKQQVERLSSDLCEKDSACKELGAVVQSQQNAIDDHSNRNKEKDAHERELQEKIATLCEQLEAEKKDCLQKEHRLEELNHAVNSYSEELSSLKEKLQEELQTKSDLSASLTSLSAELHLVKNENAELLGKVDLGLKAQEELDILHHTLKERDEKLIFLTESAASLSQEVTQLNSVNELLRAREDDLSDVQGKVQSQLQILNEDIVSLKEKNEKLSEKEVQLIEKEREVGTLRESLETLESERQSLLLKQEELIQLRSEFELMTAKVLQLETEKGMLEEQCERVRVLTLELSETNQQKEMLIQEVERLKHSHDDMNKCHEENSAELLSNLEKISKELENTLSENVSLKEKEIMAIDLNERIRMLEEERRSYVEVQAAYNALSEEKRVLEEQLNEAATLRDQDQEIVDMEEVQLGSSPSKVDVELMQVSPSKDDVAFKKDERESDNIPTLETTEGNVPRVNGELSALKMAEPALSDNAEIDKLKILISEKDGAIMTLHQNIQLQQQGLQDMHQKLTEYTQYINALSQENQQLKSQAVTSQAMETDSSPKQVAAVSTTASVMQGQDDSKHKGSAEKEESALQVQIEEQKVMLKELTNQLQVLVDENHALKSQTENKASDIPTSSDGESATPESSVSSQSDVASLHAYIHQQNEHMKQMKQRIVDLTHYVNQVQEQNTLLQEKDASNADAIKMLTQEHEQATLDKQQMELLQSQDQEELAKASASLTDLEEENKKLKQKEKESSEVVQHLMSDLETVKRRRADSPGSSDGDSPVHSTSQITQIEHNRALSTLRAELEEQHGEQIVEMKHQLREQLNYSMEEMLNAITAERDEALALLEAKNMEPTEEQRALFSHEEMESLHLEIQQLQIKLREYESERLEYVEKVQNQQQKYGSDVQSLTKEKAEMDLKLIESLRNIETIQREFDVYKTKSEESSCDKERYMEEMRVLNERVMEVMTERDEALDKVGILEDVNKQIQSRQMEEASIQSPEVDSIAQEQVAEMNRQLQQLAQERDEALEHIQKQQEQLNAQKDEQPDQSFLQQQVGEALRHEIDALNTQLQEMATAKEEAITKIRELEYQVQGHQAAQVSLPETPEKQSDKACSKQSSPASRKLSPMQQHLLQLQQQLAQEAPMLVETVEKTESQQLSNSLEESDGVDSSKSPDTDTDALRLAQIQAIYDDHCKHQAHQNEQLAAELQRTVREKEEVSSELEKYQKHYESQIQKMVSQYKIKAEEEIRVVNEEMKDVKQTRDELQHRLETLQAQYKAQLGEMSEQMKGWQSKYHDLSEQVNGDVSMEAAHLRVENHQLRESLDEYKIKADSAEKEKEEAQSQVKELKIVLYDLEGKDPNVASYRTRLEDIESTLKVTWIENEELKSEVAVLKSKLSPEDLAAHVKSGGSSCSELADVDTLRARLTAAEAELEKIQPLVSVEVIVLTRQIEELKQTYSHQLRIHNQELVSVKRELARYQNLDSDSSDSPIHVIKGEKHAVGREEKVDSDSLSLEMGRFQAEHQLEVEGLKRTKGEVTDELNEEKERHRDAMSRIEQLLKKMVDMQHKHKEEMEDLKQSHEESIQNMSIEMEQLQLINLQNTSDNGDGGGGSQQLDKHLERLVSEKQRLLLERDQLQQEKRDWDHERDRLKGRIAQIVGEKDLLAKERDALNKSIEQVHKDQQELDTQMRLLSAEKQQVLFEREQVNYLRQQQGSDGEPGVENSSEHIARLQAECERLRLVEMDVAKLRDFEEQVKLLQQERALLVNDHKEETTTLTSETQELKQKLDEAENEKEAIREQLGFEISELLLKVESLEHGGPLASGDSVAMDALIQEIEKLKVEKMEIVKEMEGVAIERMADWKLEREKLEDSCETIIAESVQRHKDQAQEEIQEIRNRLSEVSDECDGYRKELDELQTEREQLMEALRTQETEIIKLQTACSSVKEERDTLHNEHMKMLDTIQTEGSDVAAQLSLQIEELTKARQVLKEEQALALQALQNEYEQERLHRNRVSEEVNLKHKQDLEECSARLEAELGAYKQKHAEVLEEVHTLRRENYEMRTLVSDHAHSQVKTTLEVTQGHPVLETRFSIQADSLSPDSGGVSEPEREYLRAKEEYESKLSELQAQYDVIRHERDSLSEQYENSQRKLKFEYEYDLQAQTKKIKEQSQLEVERQMKITTIENERKFVRELQNVRRELRQNYEDQINSLTQQLSGSTTDQQSEDIKRQAQNQELAEAHQQINVSHRHQEELEQEVRDISSQNEALRTEIINLQQHLAGLKNAEVAMQHDATDSKSQNDSSHPASDQSSEYSDLLNKYSRLLDDYQKLTQRLERAPRSRTKTPSVAGSYTDSLEDGSAPNGDKLHEELVVVKGENNDLRENMTELMDKYIQVVADNETLRSKRVEFIPEDSLDNLSSLSIVGDDAVEASRLQARYDTIAEQNEVLRAQLGSYGLPTESVAEEEETLDLKSRYELIMKENETFRAKLQAYTDQGSVERDGRWKEKYEAILHDYDILRSQLEELGLPINDSIQKGLEELQIKFDQVVKEKETLQIKLSTVRENAEQDFSELKARHSDLHAMHNALASDHAELKKLLEKDKDKSKRDYLKIKSKLANITKETEALKNKLTKANKEAESFKTKFEQAESKLKQDASGVGGQPATCKAKKRKQERGNHSRGRKQRRESEALDDSIEMADQNLQEELEALKSQYTTVLKENDSLQSEVGSLKCELGSLKARLIDSLRHRLRGPPIAQSTPYDLGTMAKEDCDDDQVQDNHVTPPGRPSSGTAAARLVDFGGNNTTSDLDLTSPADVEALRLRYEEALQELNELRKELDIMNSKALDELMGLQSEADHLEEENASMKQELSKDGPSSSEKDKEKSKDSKSYQQLQQRYRRSQEELETSKKRIEEIFMENDRLQKVLRKANIPDDAKEEYAVFKEELQKAATATKRTIQSETDIEAEKAQIARAVGASDAQIRKGLTSHTVSLGGVDVDVMVGNLPVDIDVDRRLSMQKSYSLTSVLPRSILEGGSMEAEWRRMVRMRSRAASLGEPILEEGFHPESDSKMENSFGGFIPDSESMGAQLVWTSGSQKSDQGELQLMPIEEEFKLQLEAMVANFGEKNVREQLGRDYVEMHQRCEAMREENEHLQVELLESREQINKISQKGVGAKPEFNELGSAEADESDRFYPGTDEEKLAQLEQDIKQLRDENRLILQENADLESKLESLGPKSPWVVSSASGEIQEELQHLKRDKDNLEAEVAKIISFYSKVNEIKETSSQTDEETAGEKRLDQEMLVLETVLDALKKEQLKVESQIQERKGAGLPSDSVSVMGAGNDEAHVELTVPQVQGELARLRDENQLLVQENALLVAKYESRVAKSALDGSILSAELGDELEHLKRDKGNLEEEVAKIKSLYLQVNEEKGKLSAENEELYGNKDRLEREMQVLRTVLDTLRQEQRSVESQISARAGSSGATSRAGGVGATSQEVNEGGGDHDGHKQRKGKTSRKSPSPSVQATKSGTLGAHPGKKGSKNPSGSTPESASKANTPSKPSTGKEGIRGASPMKLGKEPPKKSKKVSQTQLYASGESLVAEEKVGVSQLKQKVKELTAKNKSLNTDIEKLRKDLSAADKSKDIIKLQKENKALLQELEEMRGSLQSQAKLMDQLQDLRGRIEALSKEKETLKKENQVLSDRINDEVSPPMLEHEDLKMQNAELVKKNTSLMEKLDRDLMQAEHELADIREKYEVAQTQKEEIEDEYKNFREKWEKEMYNLQSRYDEAVEERDFLEGQLINTKEHAEKDYNQLQAGYEELRNEYEELQKVSEGEKDRWRKELSELKTKLNSVKIDNEELKREVVDARDNVEHEKNNLQQHCALLQEEKHNLNRELKDYQNRLNAAEKAKDDIEKQKRDIAAQFESVEKYYDELKSNLEEENQMLRNKVGSLQEEYDQLSDSIKELKMEKFSLSEDLNESRAWCETLEMNLKETETSMSKENYTLKEELRFISEKLETETNVKSSAETAEEDLRQKLVGTSQELGNLRREAASTKEKMANKLENLQAECERLKHELNEKESEKSACDVKHTTLQDTYNNLLKEFEELSEKKNAIEKEYRQIRDRYGITETQLSEFRRSVLTENVESEKLISKFRVQFEQVTMERNNLQSDKEVLSKQLEEAKAKYIVQKEDNKVLRRALGAEVDLRFQNVSQIESLLGEEGPSLSPVSPLSPSPAPSECGSECSEDTGTVSEALITKLHRQNTSLALLIESLAKIKIAKDNQVSSLVDRCNSLQTSLNESILIQQESSHHEDHKNIEEVNSELNIRLQETENKLQETIARCRVLEEELLRLQRSPGDGSTSKCREKYVVEMEEDLLTVSTVVVEEGETLSQESQPEVCSPAVMNLGEVFSPGDTNSEDDQMTSVKNKSWQAEYLVLQDKYMALLQEHEQMWRRVRGQPSPVHEDGELSGELTIEITDASVLELIAENSRMQSERRKLESELMSQKIDRIEIEAAYTELTWLKEQKEKYEKKLKLQHNMYEKEKQLLEQRLRELQINLDQLLSAKTKSEEDTRMLKRKYKELLSLCGEDVKALAEEMHSKGEREKIIAKVTSESQLRELETQLKSETDEKEFLRVQVAHLKKECDLYDRHVRDLEKEIEAQYGHLHAASREHKTMVQLLAETKLELELNREKHQEFSKIGETVERIEAQLSGRSTPQFAMMHSPPVPTTSGTTSPSMASEELAPDEQPELEQQRLTETSRIVEEMMQLRQEIVEAKSMYTHGNTLLKQAQLQSKIKSEHKAIKEELSVIEEQNQLLKNENEELQKRLSEQEEFVFHVQAQLATASTDDGKNNLEAVFSQQLELLRSQRDSLQTKLLTMDELQNKHMALLREKSVVEEKYEHEQEMLRQKLHTKEINELELIRKIAALERHIREQQRLEELIYHKIGLQNDILRQKETFDMELGDVEKTLQERRNIMKNERVMLLGELKQKHWQRILRQDGASERDTVVHTSPRESPKHIAAGFERLSRMKTEVEQRYKEAIERLRKELHAENEQSSPESSPAHQ